MVDGTRPTDEASARLWDVAATVVDPEIPVLTIEDLGILRSAFVESGQPVVEITPTYSGCPAMETIRADVRAAVADAHLGDAQVRIILSPAWSTQWMSEAGKRKLTEFGIAAPTGRGSSGPIPLPLSLRCPRCHSANTTELSRFGSTSCKALWQCRDCAEPFDHFKDL